jgi:hypothetical protein
MTRLRSTLVCSAVVLASACTAAANGGDDHAAADTLVYTGVVQQSGSGIEPTVVLQQHGGAPVRLAGDLLAELERLAGGTVRVDGHWNGAHGGSLDVIDYELLSIAGAVPVVGVLDDRGGSLWLRSGNGVQLLGAPAELREHVGARVWVVGETETGGLRLQSYGVIAEP